MSTSRRYGSLEVPPEDEIHQGAKTRRRDEKTRRRDEKTRKLVKKTRRRDKTTKRQDPQSRQVNFVRTRRQEGKIRDLVESTRWGWEDKKTRSWISSSRLRHDEKTIRQDPGSRQVDFVRTRRQEDKILDLVKSTSSGREDKKTSSSISWSRLHQDEKTRRQYHGSRQVDFMRMRS